MASHLSAIGFPPEIGLQDAISRVIDRTYQVGESVDGRISVIAYDDPSGSRVTLTLEQRSIVCLTPTFRPGSEITVRIESLAADECPYERPLLVWLDDDGQEGYPLAVQVDDLAVSEGRLAPGSRAKLEVVGLAESITVFADEAALRASGSMMASRSLIPTGMFALPGTDDRSTFAASPRVMMNGEVSSAELLSHSVLGGRFVRMTVDSYGATYVVLAAASDLSAPDGSVAVPAPGAIVSGDFWLSGRLSSGGALADLGDP